MPTTREALSNFFDHQIQQNHYSSDLLARYTHDMEIQINVDAEDGDPVPGRRGTYSNGSEEWWNIRIPKNAMTEPVWHDYDMKWSLADHAKAIGMTGWDWANKKSRWVGFDVDSIIGHAAGIGINDQELNEVKQKAFDIPWVQLRRSTGGLGYHLYVLFDNEGIPTANHTTHAALARCVLGLMSSAVGFDFSAAIDGCGGNMWVWHQKATQENKGLSLVKQNTEVFSDSLLPVNWQDHIEVIQRKRAKVRVRGIPDGDEERFTNFSSSRQSVTLDPEHKRVIDLLENSGFSTLWCPDHHLLQTHTVALKKLANDPTIQGFFDTISPGDNPEEPNCFMFPLEGGSWKVCGFQFNIVEHPMWVMDESQWDYCYFNKTPDLATACRAMGGNEEASEKSWVFDSLEKARPVARSLKTIIDLPDELNQRETKLLSSKSGRLVVMVKAQERETCPPNWLIKKGWFVRIYTAKTVEPKSISGWSEYDSTIRNLASVGNKEIGWVQRQEDGRWIEEPLVNIKNSLRSYFHSDSEANMILGWAVRNKWTEVNLPFQDEYPGNRTWNRKAAQFCFLPTEILDNYEIVCPHWWKILNHLGQDLDVALKEHTWAQKNNVKTGGEYLLMWITAMFRFPFDPLPYLFFHGPEESGKSIFHEAISLLVTQGVVQADRALVNKNDFNGELANAILAYVEEIDISTAGALPRNRMKAWVTSLWMSIRGMRMDSYMQRNTCHFVQMANFASYCLAMPGDTRITSMYVGSLGPGEEIPKSVLLAKLKDEAPHFMRLITDTILPEPDGRLRIPMVATAQKIQAAELRKTVLEIFIEENVHFCLGHKISFNDFWDKFRETLFGDEKEDWNSKITVSRFLESLPTVVQGRSGPENQKYIGNITFNPEATPQGVVEVVGHRLHTNLSFVETTK